MRLKRLITLVTPPVLLAIIGAWRKNRGVAAPIWEGIYRRLSEVPVSGEGLGGPTWLELAKSETAAIAAARKASGARGPTLSGERSLLPVLASLICCQQGRVRILDVGGGLGVDYISLGNSMPTCQTVDYHVVENERLCAAGEALFAQDRRIHFHRALPSDLTSVDVVHMNSVLQYVEDYAGLLKDLCAYRPRYLLFVRLSAGEFPTYASAQRNIPGMTLAYWFINVQEIIGLLSANGYALVFKSTSEDVYDQGNFPSDSRLERTCNLLFARSTARETESFRHEA